MKARNLNPLKQCAPAAAAQPITPEVMLAAARQFERALRRIPPLDFQMRIFENGSVFFRNVREEGLERLFSISEMQELLGHSWLNSHSPPWRHILAVWR